MVEASGISDALQYLKRLQNDLPAASARVAEDSAVLSAFQERARDIMRSVVYAVYNPQFYIRSEAMINNVVAVASEGGIAVAEALNFETEAVSGAAAGQVTYARFMLPEFYTKSFWYPISIEHKDVKKFPAAHPPLPRDFLEAWKEAFGDMAYQAFASALEKELKK